MEYLRARQIMESPETIYVSYQNIPVWIDEVKDNDVAAIRDLNSDIRMEVPVQDLAEIQGEPSQADPLH